MIAWKLFFLENILILFRMCYVWIHVRIWKNEESKASDYNLTPISRCLIGDGRGLLVVFLTRESATLVQSQGPSLFIIKSCNSSLVTDATHPIQIHRAVLKKLRFEKNVKKILTSNISEIYWPIILPNELDR